MKIILNILIVVLKLCASDSTVYDWHVRTIERDSDFGNDFKVQTALNNERQQDLLKISGKTNNIDYYPDSYYQIFNKDINDDGHKKNFNFDEYNRNILNDEIAIKHEDKSDFKSIFERKHPEIKNYYNDDLFHLSDKQTVRPNSFAKFHKSFLKSNRNFNDDNNIKNINYEVEDKQILAKNKNGKILEENEKVPLINNVVSESFVGTNLFDSTAKRCFSTEEVALLAARKDFEKLIPKDLPQSLFNDHMVAMLLNYVYISHQMIIQTTSIGSRHLVKKAFYDTLGGFLNFYMVPVTKYSYYAGQISLSNAQQVLTLHQECKQFLNTNGNGWKAPLENVLIELKSVFIEPLHIPDAKKDLCNEPLFCSQLSMNTDENQPNTDEMIIQLPKLEAENEKGYLGNIWLPFRGKRTFDLKSDSSAYIVVKFYETVTNCYRFKNIDQEFYNRQYKTLLLENINIHLSDEEFYPGLGAVLRINEYLKRQIKDSIGISNDLEVIPNEDERFKKQETSEQLHYKRTKHNKSYKKLNNLNSQNNLNLTKDIVDQQPKAISEEDTQQKTVLQTEATNFKIKLRTLDLTPPQIAVVAIPVVAIILVIIICCCKSFCKKKKTEIQLKPKKNSSSSSSNLLNSPVRFFHVRKKSASGNTTVDYSSNEVGNKKIKKSVKIEKKPLLHSDSSISSSPIRNKKSKESTGSKDKAKNKDSAKSNV